MSEVELYITGFGDDIKSRLFNMKLIIQEEFPQAEPILYHGMPAFFQDGRDIISFGAAQQDIILYPGSRVLSRLKLRYPELQYTRATIRFPGDEPLPYELLREICDLLRQVLPNH